MGLICAAAFTLTNCTKELESQSPVKEGVPFEIIASTGSTKTTNDGLDTKWASGDNVSVFHAEAGSTSYGSNDEFKYTSGDSFTGKLTEALVDGKSYDWYVIYKYYSGYKTPAATASTDGTNYIGYRPGITQNGLNSTKHLSGTNCTLYGVAKNIAADQPVTVNMKHLTSVVKINVKNTSGADLTVSSVEFTAEEDIVGSYAIDITGASPVYVPKSGSVSNVAKLNATGETTIANGASGAFYIPIKPFTAATGSKLSISVNGTEKEKTLESDVTFTAGKIKTLNYTVSAPIVEYVTLFSESFGNNSSSARAWDDSYKNQGGISSVYSGSTYTITNAKQSKNTGGKTQSGLIQSTKGNDAIFEIKGLNVAGYSDLSVSYYWKAASIKETYSTSLYYSKDGGETYTEVEKTSGTGATSFVEVKYALPADAVLSNLCLKVVFNTSNTQAVIDEFVLKGTN